MAKIHEDRIFLLLTRFCWVMFGLLLIGSASFGSRSFTAGIAAGGTLSMLNLYWLRSILVRALAMSAGPAARYSQLRYLLRLGITGIVLYFLIVKGGMSVFGLLAGLSVVVFAVVSLTIYLLCAREVS